MAARQVQPDNLIREGDGSELQGPTQSDHYQDRQLRIVGPGSKALRGVTAPRHRSESP